MKLLTLIVAIAYIIYTIVCWWKNDKKYVDSLSATHYLWKNKYVFPTVISCLGFGLLPCWLEAMEGSDWQALAFFSCVNLILIGTSPDYRNDKRQYKTHMWCAYSAAALSLIVLIFVTDGWFFFPIFFCLGCFGDMFYFEKNIVYHLEDALILSVFFSVLWNN